MASETTNFEINGDSAPVVDGPSAESLSGTSALSLNRQSNSQLSCQKSDSVERSNNATAVGVSGRTQIVQSVDAPNKNLTESVVEKGVRFVEKQQDLCSAQLDPVFEYENEEGFCVLRRGESDEYLEQDQEVEDQEVDADVDNHSQEYVDPRNVEDSPYTDSPGVFSQEEFPSGNEDDDTEYTESVDDDRITNIEEEYIQRIYGLEQRHYELEDVLARLASCLDEVFRNKQIAPEETTTEYEPAEYLPAEEGTSCDGADFDVDGAGVDVDGTDKTKERTTFNEKVGFELFIEFQSKLRSFANDLNGVLNCSEAAIRHARVVQQWATSVQFMFEQIKEERTKILNYVDERERNMLLVKEQYISEFQQQGKQLKQLVEDMNSFTELRESAEDYLEEEGAGKNLACSIVDAVLEKRMQHEEGIMLSLNKQSKISELKLFIIHQQNCIQQIQEQNKELKAIIEGLMGPDDIDEEEELCDTDQSGTPASVGTPDHCPVREVLNKLDDSRLCLVSDILHCDRGEYLAGTSTDGDIATIQAYNIGDNTNQIDAGENTVFDPLSVSYVKKQCQMAEETERQIHESGNIVVEDLSSTDKGVQMIQTGLNTLNIEPDLRNMAGQDGQTNMAGNQDAAGDGINKTPQGSPNKGDVPKPEVKEDLPTDIPTITVSPPSKEDQ